MITIGQRDATQQSLKPTAVTTDAVASVNVAFMQGPEERETVPTSGTVVGEETEKEK